MNGTKETHKSFAEKKALTEWFRIEVHQAEKIDGVHVQKLRSHYSCVGAIEIPETLPLAEPDVLIQTRKGVAVSYSAVNAVV